MSQNADDLSTHFDGRHRWKLWKITDNLETCSLRGMIERCSDAVTMWLESADDEDEQEQVLAGQEAGLSWAVDLIEGASVNQLFRTFRYVCSLRMNAPDVHETALGEVCPEVANAEEFWLRWAGETKPPLFFVRGFFAGVAEAMARERNPLHFKVLP